MSTNVLIADTIIGNTYPLVPPPFPTEYIKRLININFNNKWDEYEIFENESNKPLYINIPLQPFFFKNLWYLVSSKGFYNIIKINTDKRPYKVYVNFIKNNIEDMYIYSPLNNTIATDGKNVIVLVAFKYNNNYTISHFLSTTDMSTFNENIIFSNESQLNVASDNVVLTYDDSDKKFFISGCFCTDGNCTGTITTRPYKKILCYESQPIINYVKDSKINCKLVTDFGLSELNQENCEGALSMINFKNSNGSLILALMVSQITNFPTRNNIIFFWNKSNNSTYKVVIEAEYQNRLIVNPISMAYNSTNNILLVVYVNKYNKLFSINPFIDNSLRENNTINNITSNIIYDTINSKFMIYSDNKLYSSSNGLDWDSNSIGNKDPLQLNYIIQNPTSSFINCIPVCLTNQTCNHTTGQCIDDGSGDGGNGKKIGINWMWVGIAIGILSIILIIYINIIKKIKTKYPSL
jgi:hypothetical protein